MKELHCAHYVFLFISSVFKPSLNLDLALFSFKVYPRPYKCWSDRGANCPAVMTKMTKKAPKKSSKKLDFEDSDSCIRAFMIF